MIKKVISILLVLFLSATLYSCHFSEDSFSDTAENHLTTVTEHDSGSNLLPESDSEDGAQNPSNDPLENDESIVSDNSNYTFFSAGQINRDKFFKQAELSNWRETVETIVILDTLDDVQADAINLASSEDLPVWAWTEGSVLSMWST